MLGLLGKKLGMTQAFGKDGEVTPVTAVQVGPCTVVQKKTVEADGYNAIQIGFGTSKPKRMAKALCKHFEKRGLTPFAHLREFRMEDVSPFEVGQILSVAGFKEGDIVHVSGITKGRGFQGVMKRHGKHGGPAAHGSDFHRRPGSIGMRTWPGHVLKNMKLPGHMGDVKITTRNLKVIAVRPDDDVILIKGALPGSKGGLVMVTPTVKDFEKRPEIFRKGEKS